MMSANIQSGVRWFMLLVFWAACAHAATAEPQTSVIIDKGQAVAARTDGAAWARKDGALVGSGTGNFLYATKIILPGDFRVTIEMTITDLAKSAATVMLNDSHFGFTGKDGAMFTEGDLSLSITVATLFARSVIVIIFLSQNGDQRLSRWLEKTMQGGRPDHLRRRDRQQLYASER